MESKGSDALLKTTRVTEWSLHNGGCVSLAFGGLLLFGCILAYIIAVSRGNVDAILPLISDAAGSPPQNGLFGTLICIGGMCGVMFMIQRYMIVLEKNKDKSSLVSVINKLGLFVGIVSMLGITLITGYPINFYRNRDVWLTDVGLPHMVGGVVLFSLGLCYIALQCILTLFLESRKATALSVRVLLLFICTAAFVYHMITVPEHFTGVSQLYYLNDTDTELTNTDILPYPPTMGASLKLPIDTGGSYIPSAISQWVFVLSFCCFFFTFFNEAQEYSLSVVIETHMTKEPEPEDSKQDIKKLSLKQNGSQVDTKPAPEMRKILRRDSTCQTMTDTLNEILSSKNGISNGTKDGKKVSAKKDANNGTNDILSKSEVDAKLTRLLSEYESSENFTKPLEDIPTVVVSDETAAVNDNTVVGNGNTDAVREDKVEEVVASNGNADISKEAAEKEEERVAIEEIDVIVKDAEDVASNGNKSNGMKLENEPQPSNCPMSVQ